MTETITLAAKWDQGAPKPVRNKLEMEGLPFKDGVYKFDVPIQFKVVVNFEDFTNAPAIDRFQFLCWPAPEVDNQLSDSPFLSGPNMPFHEIYRDGRCQFEPLSPGSFSMTFPAQGMDFVKPGRFSFTITIMAHDTETKEVKFFRLDPEMETIGGFPIHLPPD